MVFFLREVRLTADLDDCWVERFGMILRVSKGFMAEDGGSMIRELIWDLVIGERISLLLSMIFTFFWVVDDFWGETVMIAACKCWNLCFSDSILRFSRSFRVLKRRKLLWILIILERSEGVNLISLIS